MKKKEHNAYHEAGHCIISMFFYDELNIREITINSVKAKEIDETYNGGFDFGWKIKPQATDYISGDKIVLILLGGMCSTTIYDKGNKYVKDNIKKFPYDKKFLYSKGADVDYDIAKSYIEPIASYFQVNRIKSQWNAFFYVFHYLLIPEVWEAVVSLAEGMQKKNNKSLNHDEIIEMLEDIGYLKFLEKNKINLLKLRYPLNRNKLTLRWPI